MFKVKRLLKTLKSRSKSAAQMPPHGVTESVTLLESNLAVFDKVELACKEKPREFGFDDFKPVATLGYGDMGTVFLVVLRSTNELYAMKVMKKDIVSARKSWQRVNTERKVLVQLNHPFLPCLFAQFESDNHICLVTNYCSGRDLNYLRQQQPERRFSEAAVRFYAAEVLSALDYLHKRGIVYRDLKPENILVQHDGHIVLTDFDLSMIVANKPVIKRVEKASSKSGSLASLFGCSGGRRRQSSSNNESRKNVASKVFPLENSGKRKSKSSLTEIRSLSFVGTEEYVAPEVVWGTGHGYPVDWWTFGVLLYELFYGKSPFKGSNRKETFYRILSKDPELVGPWCPLKDLISRLLVKEPEHRLGSDRGADEIKEHMFFQGLQWNSLRFVSRPPVVPEPFSVDEILKEDKELIIDDHIRQRASYEKNQPAQQEKPRSSADKTVPARAASVLDPSGETATLQHPVDESIQSEKRGDASKDGDGILHESVASAGTSHFAKGPLTTSEEPNDSIPVSEGCKNASDGEASGRSLTLEGDASEGGMQLSIESSHSNDENDSSESMPRSSRPSRESSETRATGLGDFRENKTVSGSSLAENMTLELQDSIDSLFEHF